MSQSRIKKVRKEIRHQVQALKPGALHIAKEIVKQRPAAFPRPLWQWCISFFVHFDPYEND